jgi:hypothetical protein
MLISSYVHQFAVHAENSPSGRHVLVKLDQGHGVTMTMNHSEAAALRDALTGALLSIPEGQR